LRRTIVAIWMGLFAFGDLCAQVIDSSSNLPLVLIETGGLEIVDDPRIVANMGIINNGPGQLNRITDPFTDYDGRISIEIRGSSSQAYLKKSYGFETQDAMGENLNASLMGLPPENDWVLYAPYADKSLIRNILAYNLSRELGNYAPRTRLCEVIINGEDQGVYVLIEKVKRDRNRVDISRLNPGEIYGDDLTGGYMLKIDKQSGNAGPTWKSSGGEFWFQYEYPDYDEMAEEQKTYIRNYIYSLENRLLSEDFRHPELGYRKYLDEDAAVDLFIVNEVSKNVDGYFLSYYFYKDKDSEDGRLKMGPIWDYNLSFGNADYREGYRTWGFQVLVNPSLWWWDRLLEDPVFIENIKHRWYQVREQHLSDHRLEEMIDSLSGALQAPQVRNFERWDLLGKKITPNAFVGESFEEEIQYLRNWMLHRVHWLDRELNTWVSSGDRSVFQDHHFQAYPNPFREQLHISMNLEQASSVTMQLMDLRGMEVARVMDNTFFQRGAHSHAWNASALASGMYILVISMDGKVEACQKVFK